MSISQAVYDGLIAKIADDEAEIERLRGALKYISDLEPGLGGNIGGPTRADYARALGHAKDIACTALADQPHTVPTHEESVALARAAKANPGCWHCDCGAWVKYTKVCACGKPDPFMPTASQPSGVQALTCGVIDGAIRIVVGAETVKFATDQHPEFYDGERQTVVVTDRETWLHSVHRHLTVEAEDGSTPVSRMFDNAIADAVDRGEEGIAITPDKPSGSNAE